MNVMPFILLPASLPEGVSIAQCGCLARRSALVIQTRVAAVSRLSKATVESGFKSGAAFPTTTAGWPAEQKAAARSRRDMREALAQTLAWHGVRRWPLVA